MGLSPHGPRLKCLKCKDIVQSMHRHDFKWCKCRSCAIDGGSDYTKITGEPGTYRLMKDTECLDDTVSLRRLIRGGQKHKS